MTDKQTIFINKYLVHFNATRAAIEAGYSEDTAYSIGCENLKKPYIKEVIDIEKEKRISLIRSSNIIKANPDFKKRLINFVGIENISDFIEYHINNILEYEGLTEYIKSRSRHISSLTRYYVLERAGFKCQACGAKPSKDNDIKLHIDHIIPFSMGGSHEADNLQVLCHKCNISKGNGSCKDLNKDYE